MLNAPGVQEALTARIAAFARGFAAPPPQPPAAAAPDPFAVLGLDRSRATIEDVQRVQRHMAKLYHTDASSGGVAADAMARVNEAAAAAIQILRAS